METIGERSLYRAATPTTLTSSRSAARGPSGPGNGGRAGAQAGALLPPRTIALVQQSWARLMPISDAAAALFYTRLFQREPALRALFKSDMREQKRKLMQTLGVAVDGLSNPTRLIPILEELGARHAGYMVEARHYDLVGEALLWTLREGLGDDFTGELEAAWTQVYGLVAGVMQRGAASLVDAPAPRQSAQTPAQTPAAHAPPAPAPRTIPLDVPQAISLDVARDHDVPLHVHLTLDQPPAAARTSGLAMAILLAALCGAIMLAAASALITGTARATGHATMQAGIPTAALYILPLSTMAIAGASFLMGHLWGTRGTSVDGTNGTNDAE